MPVLLKDNRPIQKAHRLYEQFAADAAKLDMLEAREKWRLDHLSRMDDSWQGGLEEGLEKNTLETARNMLEKHYSIADIMDITGLEESVILKMKTT